jgi:predicted HicB family RNase H-like nuclease
MATSVEESVVDSVVEQILRQPYARLILPESDGTFRGEIIEFPGCIATGETPSKAFAALEAVARSWILAALERRQNIPEPIESSNDFSGRLVVRIPKSLHKKATWIAEMEGVSLNHFIVTSLSESVGERNKNITTVFVTVSSAANVWFNAGTTTVTGGSVNYPSGISVGYVSGNSFGIGTGTISEPQGTYVTSTALLAGGTLSGNELSSFNTMQPAAVIMDERRKIRG